MDFPVEPRLPVSKTDWPLRVPAPSHRHAAPSGPWPWQDLDDPIPPVVESTDNSTSESHTASVSSRWSDYPESLFPNWKKDQVERSKMKTTLEGSKESMVYHIDVNDKGHFVDKGSHPVQNKEQFDQAMADSSYEGPARVRAFFLENLSVDVMQMIGTKYNVEPFFWTSSVNWIPARYQEKNDLAKRGDHITITLKFARQTTLANASLVESSPDLDGKIDTQHPLPLISPNDPKTLKPTTRVLILDLIALHMVRTSSKSESSTIISYHPGPEWKTTSAETLYSRVYLVGRSIYWQKIFQNSDDPTFVLLGTLWYALYAWDEALEMLWEHIGELELRALSNMRMAVTEELHEIRAHLLQYASLLEDFQRSIEFIQEMRKRALEDESKLKSKSESEPESKPESKPSDLLLKECNNLLTEILRLQKSRELWDERLRNVMHLVFSIVNIEDSRYMKNLTQATVRDSAAMKQIAYLTMVFLPASFAAGIFGMNTVEINPSGSGTLGHYFATTIPLTAVTIWVIIALQGNWNQQGGEEISIWKRLWWPVVLVKRMKNPPHMGGAPYNATDLKDDLL